MDIHKYKSQIPANIYSLIEKQFTVFRPSQAKAIKAGLFEGKNLLVCTPTASGKTMVAEMAFLQHIMNHDGIAIYIVPLKALASEKHKDFKAKYPQIKTALSIGDTDSSDPYLADYDLIIATSEKMDSLIRHKAAWLKNISCLIVDEIHLLDDSDRGPTLEILITMLRQLIPKLQVIALSATIGNPKELAGWLGANLVEDPWRPVKLKKGIYLGGKIEFYE